MNWNLLPIFVAVAQARSFSHAAVKVGLRPSSVSRAISSLEEELGVQLFNRTTRQTVLTKAGVDLQARVASRISEISAALEALPDQRSQVSGQLRVTAPDDIGATILPRMIGAFSARFPGVQVDTRISNKQLDLVAEGIDAAFRISGKPLRDSTLVARKLTEFDGHVVGSPSYLSRMQGPPRTTEDAARYDWLSVPGRIPKEFGARPENITLTGDGMLFLRGLALCGLGLALLPSFLIAEDLIAGRLVRVLPGPKASSGVLYFVHAPAKQVPRKVAMLRDFAQEHFATDHWASTAF